MRTVGVLAIQGDVPEHARAIRAAGPGLEPRLVRTVDDLEGLDALTIPGGESTTVAGLIDRHGLREPLQRRIAGGLPTLGTCAGLILLARELAPGTAGREPAPLGLLDVVVRRNDYGRQRESFEAPVRVEGLAGGPFPGVFIRAPRILSVGPDAEPFAFQEDQVVGVRHGATWGLTFHPELSGDPRLLRRFLGRPGH